jgi:sugar lactone lactonase YvrE
MPDSLRPDIAFDARATLGEGPVWDAEQQWLVWLDILPGLVHRFDPATGSDDVFRVGKPVGSAGLRHGGGLVLAVEDGFALLDPGRQRLDQVAVIEHPGPPARFNEGKCDPAGRFLAGTMAYDLTPGAGSVYRLGPDLAVTKLLDGGSAVHRYTPDGRLDAVVSFPVTNVTCPAFGGPGLSVLYVTSARDGLDERQLAAQPHAGGVFAADVGARGLPALRFAG